MHLVDYLYEDYHDARSLEHKDDNRSASSSPDIITASAGSLLTDLHNM
jgi:hypothetical protein